jgi:predicted Zn-dependent protease
MRERFDALAGTGIATLRSGETLLAEFTGEASDFVRFNRGRVRQAMSVEQARIALTLVADGRRVTRALPVTGDRSDESAVRGAIDAMRTDLAHVPPDPFLLFETQPVTSERVRAGALPDPQAAVADVVAAAAGDDLVGILASGPVVRGFASSVGVRHWHAVDSFLLDWSIHRGGDKAVKASFAGEQWNAHELARRVARTREEAAVLERPARTVPPGEYRVYLAPAAVDELVGMLNWQGVSAKAQRTKSSALQRLADGEARLSPLVSLAEATAGGLAPAFDGAGFARPARVPLVARGAHAGALVSARTAMEYGIPANGANAEESMESAELDGGTLPTADALTALGDGLCIGNLWYLNYSDRPACRLTGMTRFATFLVEGGRIVAPLAVMRFDDSLYRILGDALEALTRETELIADAGTYEHRSVRASRVPGALVRGMRFVL